MMHVVFLGTGTSHGIPVIGCECEVCTSPDPRNRRNRTGVWVHGQGVSLVLDMSSEFRIGALREGLKTVDAVLLTHAHSDHISGLDDLRVFSHHHGKAVSIYTDAVTCADIRLRFAYAFQPQPSYGGGVPQFDLNVVTIPFQIGPWRITPLPVKHGPDWILGWRIGNFAFITDVTEIPESTMELLKGLDLLALDCLRREPHSTHLHLAGAIDYAQRIGATETRMIHLAHGLEHVATEAELPSGMKVAYDGLSIQLH